MYRPDVQAAIKKKHWQDALASKLPMAKPFRRPRTMKGPSISREELERKRHVVVEALRLSEGGVAKELAGLLACVEGCLSTWPRVKWQTAVKVRQWYKRLMAELDEK